MVQATRAAGRRTRRAPATLPSDRQAPIVSDSLRHTGRAGPVGWLDPRRLRSELTVGNIHQSRTIESKLLAV